VQKKLRKLARLWERGSGRVNHSYGAVCLSLNLGKGGDGAKGRGDR